MKPWIKLKNTNKKDFYSVTYDLFCKKSFNLGTNYFVRLISKFFDIPIIKLENSISKKLKSKKRVENLKKLILTNSLTIEKF